MGRAPCCEKVGLKKGPWTPEEDQKLVSYIQEHGHGSWRALPSNAGLLRCGKSCRLRWTNYLRPDIKRGNFSVQEEQTIIQLHALLGNRWSTIAQHLPKRTDNEIKNFWNTHLKKRLTKMGIDPVTHKQKDDPPNVLDGQFKTSAALSHIAQWESARMEAEIRLARQSGLRNKSIYSNHLTISTQRDIFSSKNSLNNGPIMPRSRCLDVLNAKLLSNTNTTNTNSCLTGSTTSSQLIESPTSSLTPQEGSSNLQSSPHTSPTYLSIFDKPQSSQFQFLNPADKKPITDDLTDFLLETENVSAPHQSSDLPQQSLSFPNLTDMELFPTEHHYSSTPSISSEELSPSSHGDLTTTLEDLFSSLEDTTPAPNCELPEPRPPTYWNNIFNMANSPRGQSNIF